MDRTIQSTPLPKFNIIITHNIRTESDTISDARLEKCIQSIKSQNYSHEMIKYFVCSQSDVLSVCQNIVKNGQNQKEFCCQDNDNSWIIFLDVQSELSHFGSLSILATRITDHNNCKDNIYIWKYQTDCQKKCPNHPMTIHISHLEIILCDPMFYCPDKCAINICSSKCSDLECQSDCPADRPTECPTECPTDRPTECPTDRPTECPTDRPTECPTDRPTECPTDRPRSDDRIECGIDIIIQLMTHIQIDQCLTRSQSTKNNLTKNNSCSDTCSTDQIADNICNNKFIIHTKEQKPLDYDFNSTVPINGHGRAFLRMSRIDKKNEQNIKQIEEEIVLREKNYKCSKRGIFFDKQLF